MEFDDRIDVDLEERCFLTVSLDDLRRLAAIANRDLEELFARNERLRTCYKDRRLCVALCQGAALHLVDGKNGIKDWDVWTFFSRHPDGQFPPRRRVERAFGDPRFGRSVSRSQYEGRCVDLIGRSIDCDEGTDPADALRAYLREARTTTAQLLAQKAVVLLDPEQRCGEVVWPPGAATRGLMESSRR